MKKKQTCVIQIQTVSFYVQKHDISKDIVGDVETRFNPSNYELGRPLPKGKNKNNWKN